jgi:hypothetical protein
MFCFQSVRQTDQSHHAWITARCRLAARCLVPCRTSILPPPPRQRSRRNRAHVELSQMLLIHVPWRQFYRAMEWSQRRSKIVEGLSDFDLEYEQGRVKTRRGKAPCETNSRAVFPWLTAIPTLTHGVIEISATLRVVDKNLQVFLVLPRKYRFFFHACTTAPGARLIPLSQPHFMFFIGECQMNIFNSTLRANRQNPIPCVQSDANKREQTTERC